MIAEIGCGLVVLVGIAKGDSEEDARYLVRKVLALRVFPDENDKLNLSIVDIGGELLVVSQFTLLADIRKGHRPSFTNAAPPTEAQSLFEWLVQLFCASGLRVETGHFREHMLVEICNDGPVTILLDSRD
jgi:D-tyrosyl-tRNA(Tyr) deacylase